MSGAKKSLLHDGTPKEKVIIGKYYQYYLHKYYVDEKDLPIGPYIIFYDSNCENKYYECYYVDGLPDGWCTYYYKNGKKLFECKYEQGKIQGEGIYYDENEDVIL